MGNKPHKSYPIVHKVGHFFIGFFGWGFVTSVLFVFYGIVLGVLGRWPLGGASIIWEPVRKMLLVFTVVDLLLTMGSSFFWLRQYGIIVGIVTGIILNQLVWLILSGGASLVTLGVPFWVFALMLS